jgi:hypothetical protein
VTSLILMWVASSFLAFGYDWLCAPADYIEAIHSRQDGSLPSTMCAVAIILIGGPVALIAAIIYHGKWR